jgi:GNAT superfamily N-acetyltransferase
VDSLFETRELARHELARIVEIDRTERIEVLFEQRGTELVARRGAWDARPWDPHGDGEHSVAAQRRALEQYVADGGVARGAFSEERLVGIGVLVPHLRPGISQLAYLHVSNGFRSAGIGRRLFAELELVARRAGDEQIVVSATPSEHTVGFYMSCGFEPTADPLPDLLALEPDDIHMWKMLNGPR